MAGSPALPRRRTPLAALATLLLILSPRLLAGGEPGAEGTCAPAAGCESCSAPSAATGTASAGHLAPASTAHYARLARLDSAPRPAAGGLDRRQFALSAMSPGYLGILDLPPVYLDLPPEALAPALPPANSSAQTRAELDHLLELQASRTPAQVAASQELAGVYYRLSVRQGDEDWPRMRSNLFHMGRQLGSWFSPEALPDTADFMARVWSDASWYLWAAKFRYNRIRPYELEPRLENLETPNFPAYPSGHSGNSWVAAYVYAELLPDHRELFLRNAADMAYSREILGVHYASDSESGRVFARALVDRLLEVPAFRRDLEAARREIHAAHQVAGCC